MNILQIFPGKVWGGAEQYVLDLGKALEAHGHNVVFAVRNSRAVISRLESRVEFTVIPSGPLGGLRLSPALAPLLREADVVHVHDISQAAAIVRAVHKTGVSPRIVLTRHIARQSSTIIWKRRSLLRLHRMIFVSDLARRLWCGANTWMPTDKCVTIHNSIPPYQAPHNVPDLRERYGMAPDTPLLLFTGRVRKSKGCAVIVEALGKIKELPWMMVFVGACKPTDYDKELLETAAGLGIAHRIGFMGFSDCARALVRQADVGLAPSIVREACPLSPMEFMQASKCVIATDNGAQPEYITDGETGLLVAPASADLLEKALRSVITNPGKREDIGRCAGEYFLEKLSYTDFVDLILNAYKEK